MTIRVINARLCCLTCGRWVSSRSDDGWIVNGYGRALHALCRECWVHLGAMPLYGGAAYVDTSVMQ